MLEVTYMFNEEFTYLSRTVFRNPTFISHFKFLKGFGIFYFCGNFVPYFWTYGRWCFNVIPFSTWYATVTFKLIFEITPFINSGAIPILTLNISVIDFVDFVSVRL